MDIKPSKEFFQQALTNNSFDIDATDKALRITLDHSFSYLYRLQRNAISYEEYFYTTRNNIDQPDYGDYFLDSREKVVVNFPVELITSAKRLQFRNSAYYNTKVSYDEMQKNRKLFGRMPIITIDDKILRSFDVEIFDDHFVTHLPFGKDFLHTKKFDKERWEYEYIDHSTSLQIINDSFFTDVTINTGMLQRNSYDSKSYNRIRSDYLRDLGVDIDTDFNGTYFVSVFKMSTVMDGRTGRGREDIELLGSSLQYAEIDENGDLNIHYDTSTEEMLSGYSGNLLIRIFFLRNLYEYKSFRYDGTEAGKMVPVKMLDESPCSEIFMIQESDEKLFGQPIPTENLMIFRSMKEQMNDGSVETKTLISNKNTQINYPNIYRVNESVADGDRLKVYYFYLPPYDLEYEYMYRFYYNYLRYKWSPLSLEAIVNQIYFGEIALSDDPAFQELEEAAIVSYANRMVKAGVLLEEEKSAFYTYILNHDVVDLNDALTNYRQNPSNKEDVGIPTKIEQFVEVFDFVINHQVVGYYYDEIDYMKYIDQMDAFEYKVKKLKSFIRDDYKALSNYVRAQNKVGMKYEFPAEEADLPSRYREVKEGSGERLIEPMYLFTIQKPNPEAPLSARIFINGLLCIDFEYDRYEFTDYIYIPVDEVPEDAYLEIEVFPAITQKETIHFESIEDSVVVDFVSTERISPTISDLFFFEGSTDTGERIPATSFSLELVSTRYSYYIEDEEPMNVYRPVVDNIVIKDYYYDTSGHYYSFEGLPDPSKDISTAKINELLLENKLIASTAAKTGNTFEIVRDEDYVTYDRVALGETTINPDNKGMNCSFLTKIQIRLLDSEYVGKDISMQIVKEPAFSGIKLKNLSFPAFSIPIENSENAEEYTRVFRNGRLLSKNRYDYTKVDNILTIQTLEKLAAGSTAGVDITPYRNRLIYFSPEITTDQVDLRGYINKPFDMNYYEVYLNGRRLNRSNVFPISPWEIKLAGIHSIYNLEIYEKDRDWEYYGLDFKDYFTLSDFIKEAFVEKDLADRLIRDVTGDLPPNDNIEEREEWERDLNLDSVYFEIFYYNRLIPLGLANPDTLQFNDEDIATKFSLINSLFMTENAQGEKVLLLNPDKFYEGDASDRWNVYLLGNPTLENLDDANDDAN